MFMDQRDIVAVAGYTKMLVVWVPRANTMIAIGIYRILVHDPNKWL